ncbi:AlbA family DNA-binding domain-containing protein [Flavobacterium lindanitolerans]|uniref:AlbA family DNA-binding domain-containing protein n=1 Tax=Flavobacterium lindanitolerans TaxID=428988 RepID=UPI0027B890CA|nr:ATP-binding protein [Flavobacterium lindanitolerans]
MKETVINLIENESENTKLDFKQEQYPIDKGNAKKGEFLKDMCAFANLTSKEDKYIIIGIEEKGGVAVGYKPIDELQDQASYQQFLNQYIEPEINFEYREFVYRDNRLAYFRIFDNDKGPYLFKAEYRGTNPKGSHYRIGTGFVRTGSSTRELKREDFEKIYAERSSVKDRSNDIDFELEIWGFTSPELKYKGYIKHLRVDVINLSNSSIDLDVEAKIYNNKNVKAKCTQVLEHNFFREDQDKSLLAFTSFQGKVTPQFNFRETNVRFENYKEYSIYEITPNKGTHTALRAKQKGKQIDIFNGQIALVFSRPTEIIIEITVRSNDFPNGPKIFEYNIPQEEVSEFLDPWDL